MDTFLNFLTTNPSFLTAIIATIAVLVLFFVVIYLVAFLQGREISFYPAKIGVKPDKAQVSRKVQKLENPF